MNTRVFRITLLIAQLSNYSSRISALVPSRTRSFCLPHLKLSSTEERSVPPVSPKQLLPSHERQNIDSLVNERSRARWEGNYTRADELRRAIDDILVDLSWQTILQSTNVNFDSVDLPVENLDAAQTFKVTITDVPRSEGGFSHWDLLPYSKPSSQPQNEDNVLQLAHAALGMVVSLSEQGMNVKEDDFGRLIARARDRLRVLKNRKVVSCFLPGDIGCELHGRKAADAALWFALAGVKNDSKSSVHLYDELVTIATDELLRFGSNNSCRSKDILHIVERIAMSGISGAAAQRLYNVSADFLEAKTSNNESNMKDHIDSEEDDDDESDSSIDYRNIVKSLRDSSFGLHSSRSLLGLWRFSTRQRKQKLFFQNAARHYDGAFKDTSEIGPAQSQRERDSGINDQYNWSTFFEDPTRKLVVDVGCGMGVSLLGLASFNHAQGPYISSEAAPIAWEKCNFIGVDLSRLGIRYADGVCTRWDLGSRLKFVSDSAEKCLSAIKESYPGDVELVMIQFPTPFRFTSSKPAEKGYNAQLPEDAVNGNFMVTENLLSKIHDTLAKNGRLLIQSNCEDVAVHMMNTAVKQGFKPFAFGSSVTEEHLDQFGNIPKRALDWQADGGERAIGRYWSSLPILPENGRTETEVACMLDEKPVHRCVVLPQ